MTKWRVEYQGPDKKVRTTYVNVADEYTTALAVQNAIEKGEIADLHVAPGAIVMVEKAKAVSFAVSRA